MKVGLEPTRRLIVYCNTGVRAILAAAALKAMGDDNIANLAGGLKGWKEAGLPVAEHLGGLK